MYIMHVYVVYLRYFMDLLTQRWYTSKRSAVYRMGAELSWSIYSLQIWNVIPIVCMTVCV